MKRTAYLLSGALILITAALLGLGIVVLASTSGPRAEQQSGKPHVFLIRQVISLAVALAAGALASRFDYHRLRRLWPAIAAGTVLLLALVFTPWGVPVHSCRRWLRFGPLAFQPSEVAKLATVVLVAAWMTRATRRIGSLRTAVLAPGAGLAVIAGLVLAEPDFGTAIVIGTVGAAIMFLAGARLLHLAVLGVPAAALIAALVIADPVRADRIFGMSKHASASPTAYHREQATNALIVGRASGLGLGESLHKQLWLPESHTDSILAVAGEELGIAATAGTVALFAALLVCGLMVAARAPDTFGRLLAFGVTFLIVLQAAINIGVVCGLLPPKGLPLPFISYGGSNLVMSVAGIAILLNVARHAADEYVDEHTRSIRDQTHVL